VVGVVAGATAPRPQQPFNVRQVNDGNVAYTRRTARKVIER